MALRFAFSDPSRHGSSGSKKSTFGRPDRSVREAANRGEDFRTGQSVPKASRLPWRRG